MEKWKMAVIAALVFALFGYGIYQQNSGGQNGPIPEGTLPLASPTPSPWLNKSLPAWPNVTQWANTPAPIDLSKLKGNVVLVEVFRIECSHCQEAAPFMVALNQRYAPRGLKMVGIQSPSDRDNLNNPEADWKTVTQWIKDKKYTWPAGFDKHADWFLDTIKGDTFPSMFLLDKNGKVAFYQGGHNADKAVDLSVHIDKLLPGNTSGEGQVKDLTNWIAKSFNYGNDPTMRKAMQDDITKRLKES